MDIVIYSQNNVVLIENFDVNEELCINPTTETTLYITYNDDRTRTFTFQLTEKGFVCPEQTDVIFKKINNNTFKYIDDKAKFMDYLKFCVEKASEKEKEDIQTKLNLTPDDTLFERLKAVFLN